MELRLQPDLSIETLSGLIDHTKLTFSPLEDTIEKQREAIACLCDEAAHYRFKAVCVRPQFVAFAKQRLQGTDVLVATVIGFPEDKRSCSEEKQHPTVGNIPLEEKLREVAQCLSDGCDEFDLVMNVPAFYSDVASSTHTVLEEFRAIRQACQGNPVKVIIETDLLDPGMIQLAASVCAEAQVAMVKTSTGMLDGGKGGTPEAVALIAQALRRYSEGHPESYAFGIKASGGIKTLQQVHDVVTEGASRIGTSAGVSIYREAFGDT